MSLILWRWSTGVALGCASLAALLLPFPPSVPQRWTPSAPAPLAREVSRLAADVGRTGAAVRAYRAATGLDRWRTARRTSDSVSIRIDGSVPPAIAAAARSVAAEQWAALGSASGAHAEVFVYVDSTTLARAATSVTSRRPLESRRLVDVAFALPEATDGSRCVSLVRLRGTTPAHVDALRLQSLVGACGFFAAFGLPGADIRQWLEATDYRAARRSDWHIALAPATDASAMYDLGAAGRRCMKGERGGCLEMLGAERSGRSARRDPSTSSPLLLDSFGPLGTANRARSRSELGNVEGELLMSAVREFGPERFGRFWRSSAAPDVAFSQATGVTLDAWTPAWLSRTIGALPTRPTIRGSHVVWLAVAFPLLLTVAARPRERVLAERWFREKG